MRIYWHNGRKNIIGQKVRLARKNHSPSLTQQDLSDHLKTHDIDLDRYAISRIEAGNRFVADYEVIALAKTLGVTPNWLLDND